jgi:hypothetical protein
MALVSLRQVVTVFYRRFFMQEPRESWLELCELAAKEQDPDKLLSLTREINRLLEEEAAKRTSSPHHQAE